MAHIRAQIRDAVATAVAGVGLTVKKSRAYPTENDYLFVYTTSENSTRVSMSTLERNLSVLIEFTARGPVDTIDDTLDGYAVLVETLMAASNLGGLVKDHVLQSTEIAFDGEGQKPVGLMRMTYDVLYFTDPANPETMR